jgi:hypothetical protein
MLATFTQWAAIEAGGSWTTAFADFVDQINSNAGNAEERSRESVSILLYSTSLFPASLVETYRIRGNIICMEE